METCMFFLHLVMLNFTPPLHHIIMKRSIRLSVGQSDNHQSFGLITTTKGLNTSIHQAMAIVR